MRDKTEDKYYIPQDTDVGTTVSDVVVCASRVVFEKNGFVIFYCDGFSVKGNFQGNVVPGLNYKVSGTVGLYGKVLQISARSDASYLHPRGHGASTFRKHGPSV